jgi:hypothetical protein
MENINQEQRDFLKVLADKKYSWTLVYAKPEFHRYPDKLLFCTLSKTRST